MTKCQHCDADILSTSQPNRMGTTPSAEDVARTICLSYGRTPDDMTSIGEMCDGDNRPVPIWMVYEEQADAILAAHELTSPVDWRMAVEAIKRRLNISSDHDFRKWSEIERAVRSVVAYAAPSRMGTTPKMQKMYDEFGGAADVLERIASENLSDPATDDLTVPLAIELSEMTTRALKAEAALAATPAVKNLSQSLLTRDDKLPRYACYTCLHQFNWEVAPTNCPECGGRVGVLCSDATPAVGGEREALANKLDEIPLDQKHDTWPMTVRFRISETDRYLLVNVLRAQPASPLRGRDKEMRDALSSIRGICDHPISHDRSRNLNLISEIADEALAASPPEQPAADPAIALLREGERTMGNEERVQWKKRVGTYLSALSPTAPNKETQA